MSAYASSRTARGSAVEPGRFTRSATSPPVKLPSAVPALEKEGGDDEEAGHRFALGVVPLGRRVETFAYPLVGFARVQGWFFVEDKSVGLGRGAPTEGLLV